MKRFKRIIFLTVLTAVLLSVAGCGKKKNVVSINKDAVYREELLNIPFPEGFSVSSIEYKNDLLYAYGYSYDEKTYESIQQFLTCKIDGSDMSVHDLKDKNAWIDSFVPLDNGNILIFYSSYVEDESDPDEYDYSFFFYGVLFDKDGKELKRIELTDDVSYLSALQVVGDKILIMGDAAYYLLDMDLNILKTNDCGDSYVGNFFTLKDGTLVAFYWGDDGEKLKKFDIEKLELSDDVPCSVSLSNYSIMDGIGYDFFLRDNTCVYSYNISDAEPKAIMNFVDSDISTSYFESFIPVDEKTIIASYYDYEYDDMGGEDTVTDGYNGYIICKYTKVPPEEVADKQVISLGCLYLDNSIRKKIINFNKTSDQYRITVKDYSIYETDDDWEAGEKALNSDVAAGKSPDIVIANDASTIHNYISKGLFLDVKPYIEKDPDIDLNDLFPNLVEVGSSNGKYYEIIPSFGITTMVGKKSIVGDRMGWTMQEMLDVESKLKEGQGILYGTTREEFLNMMLTVNSETFIDGANGKCYFDSQDFKDLLEFAKRLPVGDDKYYDKLEEEGFWEEYDNLWRGEKSILQQTSIFSLSDYNYAKQVTFGADIALVGMPCTDKSGSAINASFSLGISSKCKNPDAAWSFIRTYLLPEYQKSLNDGYFPISMKQYDEMAKKQMTKKSDNDGSGDYGYGDDIAWVNGEQMKLEPITQADVDFVKNFIMSVHKVSGSLSDVEEIINEEAQAFFEGQKSADDVAKIIQSRVSIFINEKR